jgi:exosortase
VDETSGVGLRWTVEMLALVTWGIGAFVLSFGTRLARACAFPLLFLLWLVPLPEIAVHYLIVALQHGTAWLTREMFAAVGIPVTGSGTIVTVPGLSVEVAEECSSIRSSMILIVMATVMACLMARSYWSRLIVILIAVPLAVAKNALRVFTLEALGAYVNPAVLNSPLHHQGGVLFLLIAVAVLFGVVSLLRRLESRSAKLASNANVSHLSMTARP